MGTVHPAREVVLSPEVGGRVVGRAPGFEPGGFVRAGEPLVEIDAADYRNVLAQRQSDLRRARADLALEMGRQDVARQDYELLAGTVAVENEDLVLREPQLETARARVDSAEAAVEQAELDLRRTTVRAPFDAHVLSRDAELGSQVAAGEVLGRLVGTGEYWVEVAVPLAKLRFLDVPVDGGRGAAVRLRNRSAWPPGVFRDGHVSRLLGELAGETRLARLLVTVPDPLARDGDDGGDRPPLMIGSYLAAHLQGEPIEDVVRLDRDYLRQDDTVWVMEDGKLRIRDAEVVFRDARWAYVGAGLEDGDRIVTTNLSTVVEGAALRLEGEGRGRREGAVGGGQVGDGEEGG